MNLNYIIWYRSKLPVIRSAQIKVKPHLLFYLQSIKSFQPNYPIGLYLYIYNIIPIYHNNIPIYYLHPCQLYSQLSAYHSITQQASVKLHNPGPRPSCTMKYFPQALLVSVFPQQNDMGLTWRVYPSTHCPPQPP